MKRMPLIFVLLLTAAQIFAQAAPAGLNAEKNAGESELGFVLAKMNANAGKFKSAQADFEFETYQKVVDEKDLQKGRIYFHRSGKGVEAAFNITSPAPKQVVFNGNEILMYEPRIDQLTKRDVSKNKADVEAFLSLGFGARGDDLERDYEVKLAGWEQINHVKTARLELVPKKEKLRQTYNKIILWIDPEQDVLLQQKFIEPSDDYRLARYSNMKLNSRLPEDAFKLKTTANTKTVRSQ